MIMKVIFSLVFAIFTILKLFFKLEIDDMTVILVLLVFLPWIIQELKEIELTGIGKFKLQDKEKEEIKEDIKEIEKNIKTYEKKHDKEGTYINVEIEDPTFILVKIRFDIEKILQEICNKNKIDIINKHGGINTLSQTLLNHKIISKEEFYIIRDILGILNRAVHSNLTKSDIESYNLVVKYSDVLIESLKSKL